MQNSSSTMRPSTPVTPESTESMDVCSPRDGLSHREVAPSGVIGENDSFLQPAICQVARKSPQELAEKMARMSSGLLPGVQWAISAAKQELLAIEERLRIAKVELAQTLERQANVCRATGDLCAMLVHSYNLGIQIFDKPLPISEGSIFSSACLPAPVAGAIPFQPFIPYNSWSTSSS
jgi:hypothetical protein